MEEGRERVRGTNTGAKRLPPPLFNGQEPIKNCQGYSFYRPRVLKKNSGLVKFCLKPKIPSPF